MLFIICGVTECMADVNTSAFLHKKDVIDLNNNSIEFTYWDGCDHKVKAKNYTISSDWCSAMIIWGEDLTGTIGTNTTIYGPYTWLPAGDYIHPHFSRSPVGINYGRCPSPPSSVRVSPVIYLKSGDASCTHTRPISSSASPKCPAGGV